MSYHLLGSVAILLIEFTMSAAAEPWSAPNVVLGIHGGTSGRRAELNAELDQALRADLTRALESGHAALSRPQGTPLDAVEAAIRVMEDSPHFNAGKGAIFTREGRNELDASIMDGKTRAAGAVGFVTTIKNPITAARAVMEKTKHVLLVGPGAETFAEQIELEIVAPEYFRTERRWEQHQRELREETARTRSAQMRDVASEPWSTVGAVALDGAGNLAAGTSTGGTSNKLFGRLGDSPIVGAGTYADNESCAVSGTGRGEFFIRWAVAYDIGALMKYRGMSLAAAADEVIMHKLKPAGGDGGVVALDSQGNFAAPYNTPGMHRGWITRDGKIHVRLCDE
ncbi:MAG: isoaspartyl peptidase/L-asparaginase [Pirellulales bacterium]